MNDIQGNDREAELAAAVEAIRQETWKPRHTLKKLRQAIALILQDLKLRYADTQGNHPDP